MCPEQTGHRVPVVHQHHPVLGDQVAVGGAPLILFLPRQHQGAGQAVPPHIRLAHLGVLGGGSVEQYRLQTGQGRVVIQFLRCQQHHRRSFRLGWVVGVGQGLLDGVPVHSGSLRFPVCFPCCTTLGGNATIGKPQQIEKRSRDCAIIILITIFTSQQKTERGTYETEKAYLIVVSVLVVAALGLGGWYLLSDRQPPELTTVATYQAECGRAVMVEELVARVADHSSYEVTLSGDGAVSQDGKCITFPKTGTFPVTVEAVDAKGNRVQQTVTVTADGQDPPELTVNDH